ncbi:MAG: hypothetical protein HYZ29_22365 [Myxococcales bacterium]|nr:hypothetical protein [Myxococcales bacterium]
MNRRRCALLFVVLFGSTTPSRADEPPDPWALSPAGEPGAAPPPPAQFPADPAFEAEPHADEAPVDDEREEPRQRPEQKPRERWYGGEILLADVASITLLFAAPPVGAVGYLFGGPIVHAAHGEGGNSVGSFGVRVAMPMLGALGGCAISGDSGDWGCLPGAVLGLGAGVIAASAIDASVIAYQEQPARPRTRGGTLAATPRLGIGRHGASFGLAGQF